MHPLSSSSDLDALRDAVGLARVDLLARLGDGREHLLVGQVVLGNDGGGLALEGDLVRLDACGDDDIRLAVYSWDSVLVPFFPSFASVLSACRCKARGDGCRWLGIGSVVWESLPSSFLRTLSTAPEHPEQLMLTLNL